MPTDHRAALRSIRTFPALVGYLRDEMGWPIETDDLEELTFDHDAEELGIDPRNAAKIEAIKSLRPFSTNQAWGIFFVQFEPRRLPVVALRRILSGVALKKRESANSAERPAWRMDDLLFISNYGEGDQRQISFAHFAQASGKADLPTLKVLGWDDRDTALHLDAVADTLTRQLAWPQDESNLDAWRNQWRGAFTLGHREVITTSQALSVRLAALARRIRIQIQDTLPIENERGPLTRLLKAFQQALLHDLDNDGFADMYAQTIAYGLLAARVENPKAQTADALPAHMPVTNPFLKELMTTFLKVGGRQGAADGPGLDFDELGISEVVALLDAANMEAVVKDFGDKNRDEDPVIHFYEVFLKEYDAKKRMQRGVFYTPHPVVSYIVRSVHELLQIEFGLEDGLASTETWVDMLRRQPDLKLPTIERLNPNNHKPEVVTIPEQTPFVQILDPATGTATFLVEVIAVIHRTLTVKWKAQRMNEKQQQAAWNDYVPKHLLPRLHGYELMMAPYAIAHMKIGLKLQETGYRFQSEERVRVYLTNALEPASDAAKQQQFEALAPALAHEAQAVNSVKRNQRFTVVIGNPPYSRSSSNKGAFIEQLMESYKTDVRDERNIQPLSDDYIKFIRLSEYLLTVTGVGVHGLITNNTFLSGRIHRGMRKSLLNVFPRGFTVNLHGSGKVDFLGCQGLTDENVFDILQGVSISVLMAGTKNYQMSYIELIGQRQEKYKLLTSNQIFNWQSLEPIKPYFLWIPRSATVGDEYNRYISLEHLFQFYSVSGKPGDDKLLVSIGEDEVLEKLQKFRYLIGNDRPIKLTEAERNLEACLHRKEFNPDFVSRYAYRPFDTRFTYYDVDIWTRAVQTLNACVDGTPILLTTKIVKDHSFAHVFVSRIFADVIFLSNTSSVNTYSFPSKFYKNGTSLRFGGRSGHNLDVGVFTPRVGLVTHEDAFSYIYALLHSPTYRERYIEFLQYDFPRLPLTSSLELFRALSKLGGELVALHLMESPKLDQHLTTYTGNAAPVVDKVSYANNTVWLDKKQSCGFIGVPENVWNFHIGGYQVCNKWLKDRKGRTLSADDRNHYQRIVVALSETIRLMAEIDEVIEKNGGWPGAFSA